MRHRLFCAAFAGVAIVFAGPALAADQTDEIPRTEEPLVPDARGSAEKIRAILIAKGYTLTRVELEGGLIKDEATKDGKDWEVMIDTQTGDIVRIIPGA